MLSNYLYIKVVSIILIEKDTKKAKASIYSALREVLFLINNRSPYDYYWR